jgi:putative addiction module killer protein
MYEIQHYLTADDERDLYVDWLEKLRDTTAKISVVRRVTRIEQGNFGDHKFCRDGVWELRIDVGAGYRVLGDNYLDTPVKIVDAAQSGVLRGGGQAGCSAAMRR